MNIAEWPYKGKEALSRVPKDVLLVAILLLSVSAAFGLGYLTGEDTRQGSQLSVSKVPLTGESAVAEATSSPPTSMAAGGKYVASKTGTKYYLPWCGGVKTIKDSNKVWFASKTAAEAAGYAPAANCKGI